MKKNTSSCRNKNGGGCGDGDTGKLSVAAAARHYGANFRERAKAELAHFAGLPTLKDAIRAAAASEDEEGKRLSHQRRLSQESIREATRALLNAAEMIQECANFDEVFTLVEETVSETQGIGELFVYDVALRIGAWLKFSPDKVYLHRGTQAGAKALGLDTSNGTLEMSALPPELQRLPPGEVEDILCIYKDRFSRR